MPDAVVTDGRHDENRQDKPEKSNAPGQSRSSRRLRRHETEKTVVMMTVGVPMQRHRREREHGDQGRQGQTRISRDRTHDTGNMASMTG